MKKNICIFLLISVLFSLCAENIEKLNEIEVKLENILSKQQASLLTKEKKIQNEVFFDPNCKPSLTPKIAKAKQYFDSINEEEYSSLVECLFLHKKQKTTNNKEQELNKISSILTSLSELEGIEYFSPSRKKNRILYEKSYAVNSVKDKQKINNPSVENIDGLSVFWYQKDSTFGECVYEYNYFKNEDFLGFISTNKTSMKYLMIKIIGEENLRMSFVIQDLDSHLLVYALLCTEVMSVPFIEKKLSSSLNARIEAIYDWFIVQYEKKSK